MNIVLIHTHDTGRYIQPYGHAVPTPHLMKFARKSVLFRQAYSTAPTCSPSRTALLSGTFPHSVGMDGLAHRGYKMKDYSMHIAQYLKKYDYETVLCGIQHEAPEAKMIGYSKIIGNTEYDMGNFEFDSVNWDIKNAEKVASYLKEKREEKPFFISFGMFNTHLNFPPASDEFNPNYLSPPHPIHDNKESRELMSQYLTSAKTADKCFGIVMSSLKESNLLDNTLVIFTTDHGLPMPHMKCNLLDTGIGVSLILKTPQGYSEGKALDALVSQIDIFPTICDLAGLNKPNWLQGNSLLPLLKNETESVRNELYAEVTNHVDYEPMRCIRTKRYKFIKFFNTQSRYLPNNIDNSNLKSFLINHGLLDMHRPSEMLFDLYLDPVERVNLIDNANYKDIKDELSHKLIQWMISTDDPLIN